MKLAIADSHASGAAAPIRAGHRDAERISYYLRLASVLRERVHGGEWPAGTQLPTLPELSERYNVGRSTVRQALALLIQDGLITSTRGRGTFVTDSAARAPRHDAAMRDAINDPLATGPAESIRFLRREAVSSLPRELLAAEEGRAGAVDAYVRILKLHFMRGEPFNLADIYIAGNVFKRLPPALVKKEKMSRLLRDYGDVKIARNRQEITITHADTEVAALFGCPVGGVLVRIRRWRTDDSGALIFSAINLYRGDLFVLDLVDENRHDLSYRSGLLPTGKDDAHTESASPIGRRNSAARAPAHPYNKETK